MFLGRRRRSCDRERGLRRHALGYWLRKVYEHRYVNKCRIYRCCINVLSISLSIRSSSSGLAFMVLSCSVILLAVSQTTTSMQQTHPVT